jgi:hypothetical protein
MVPRQVQLSTRGVVGDGGTVSETIWVSLRLEKSTYIIALH